MSALPHSAPRLPRVAGLMGLAMLLILAVACSKSDRPAPTVKAQLSHNVKVPIGQAASLVDATRGSLLVRFDSVDDKRCAFLPCKEGPKTATLTLSGKLKDGAWTPLSISIGSDAQGPKNSKTIFAGFEIFVFDLAPVSPDTAAISGEAPLIRPGATPTPEGKIPYVVTLVIS